MNTYKRHRFPPDIISYAVWVYYRFNLSYRDVEDLLAERGVTGMHISNMEKGKSLPSPELIVKLAQALEADVDEE